MYRVPLGINRILIQLDRNKHTCYTRYMRTDVCSVTTKLKESKHITESGCWEWTKSTRNGYGQIRYGGTTKYVHRVAYTKYVGPIPTGMLIMHSCDNRLCFNPDHLIIGTHADNSADMVSKNRKRGRPFNDN